MAWCRGSEPKEGEKGPHVDSGLVRDVGVQAVKNMSTWKWGKASVMIDDGLRSAGIDRISSIMRLMRTRFLMKKGSYKYRRK